MGSLSFITYNEFLSMINIFMFPKGLKYLQCVAVCLSWSFYTLTVFYNNKNKIDSILYYIPLECTPIWKPLQ
jgi:hypothetical protein